MPNSFFRINEEVPHYELVYNQQGGMIDDSGTLESFGAYREWKRVINDETNDGLSLLIFGDSFFGVDGGIKNYLCPYFHEINRMHVVNLDDYAYYISTLRPDVVVFEAAERTMGKTVYEIDRLNVKNSYLAGAITFINGRYLTEERNIHYQQGEDIQSLDGNTFIPIILSLEEEPSGGLMAIANGNEYFAKKVGEKTFQFMFQKKDYVESIEYYQMVCN